MLEPKVELQGAIPSRSMYTVRNWQAKILVRGATTLIRYKGDQEWVQTPGNVEIGKFNEETSGRGSSRRWQLSKVQKGEKKASSNCNSKYPIALRIRDGPQDSFALKVENPPRAQTEQRVIQHLQVTTQLWQRSEPMPYVPEDMRPSVFASMGLNALRKASIRDSTPEMV
ncbi:hypothetical protein NA56DRAFT_666197 [Hyaloscypha hepaticicola]|uniref:Uncharacterized protein n=1 Tax=Hyaloscypha hepaticicola TaxID=2082293 RepID=A0A2J6PF17_9HELO|nr:hypothetical protein NA56DRAFT_666197 [Hyaloscypha hepaticicola]